LPDGKSDVNSQKAKNKKSNDDYLDLYS
jgi:hypothetical protein